MKYTESTINGTVEILATNAYQAIPITLSASAKAGMPLTSAGAAAADGTNAAGILLYDVDVTENPVGALVVAGIVNWSKCTAHSGATASAATMKTKLPAIEFRTNIGVNP